jgi:regulator of RNase E activity RraA
LTTPHLADACLRLGVELRCAPSAVRPLVAGARCAGRARPARHVGSVDVFFEAIAEDSRGDVLVVDNGGRLDEACVGDLVALELSQAGFAGVVIWGLHRDTDDLAEIGLPVFSMGAVPAGPRRLDDRPRDALEAARVGSWTVTAKDWVVADGDGVLFLPGERLGEVVAAAEAIRDTERAQAEAVRTGRSFRGQVRFADYLDRRAREPSHDFRAHLRAISGAVEE